MSFRCGKCHKAQPPKTSSILHVIKTRSKVYVNETGEETGKGTETVKAIRICKQCDAKIKKEQEKATQPEADKIALGNNIRPSRTNK